MENEKKISLQIDELKELVVQTSRETNDILKTLSKAITEFRETISDFNKFQKNVNTLFVDVAELKTDVADLQAGKIKSKKARILNALSWSGIICVWVTFICMTAGWI